MSSEEDCFGERVLYSVSTWQVGPICGCTFFLDSVQSLLTMQCAVEQG